MGLELGKVFRQETGSPAMSRRDVLRRSAIGAMGGLAAFALASLPVSNDAHAGEAKAATISDAQAIAITEQRRSMRKYSKDSNVKGIGVFINLRANSSVTGAQIADWLRDQLKDGETPIPFDYRVIQSQGTATNVTFYSRGVPKTMTVGEMQTRIHEVLESHEGVWLAETAGLSNPTITR